VRPARALPYALHADGTVDIGDGAFAIEFSNVGVATAVFHVRSGNVVDGPRTYTVEPHKRLSDSWDVTAIGASAYDVSVYGPNGFFRSFKGGVADARAKLDVRPTYNEASVGITLKISNEADQTAKVHVLDKYTGNGIVQELKPHQSISKSWSLAPMFGWYDLVITVDQDPGFEHQLAGHLETGQDSISDPAMG
jgi:phospholipase C